MADRFDEVLQAVDNLAQITAKSIGAVEARLDKIEDNMATKEDLANLDMKLSAKIDNLQNRQDVFAGLDRKVEGMDVRLTNVEKAVLAS